MARKQTGQANWPGKVKVVGFERRTARVVQYLVLEEWAEKFGSVSTIGLGPKRIFVC